jgi:hypothetical protein
LVVKRAVLPDCLALAPRGGAESQVTDHDSRTTAYPDHR